MSVLKRRKERITRTIKMESIHTHEVNRSYEGYGGPANESPKIENLAQKAHQLQKAARDPKSIQQSHRQHLIKASRLQGSNEYQATPSSAAKQLPSEGNKAPHFNSQKLRRLKGMSASERLDPHSAKKSVIRPEPRKHHLATDIKSADADERMIAENAAVSVLATTNQENQSQSSQDNENSAQAYQGKPSSPSVGRLASPQATTTNANRTKKKPVQDNSQSDNLADQLTELMNQYGDNSNGPITSDVPAMNSSADETSSNRDDSKMLQIDSISELDLNTVADVHQSDSIPAQGLNKTSLLELNHVALNKVVTGTSQTIIVKYMLGELEMGSELLPNPRDNVPKLWTEIVEAIPNNMEIVRPQEFKFNQMVDSDYISIMVVPKL